MVLRLSGAQLAWLGDFRGIDIRWQPRLVAGKPEGAGESRLTSTLQAAGGGPMGPGPWSSYTRPPRVALVSSAWQLGFEGMSPEQAPYKQAFVLDT